MEISLLPASLHKLFSYVRTYIPCQSCLFYATELQGCFSFFLKLPWPQSILPSETVSRHHFSNTKHSTWRERTKTGLSGGWKFSLFAPLDTKETAWLLHLWVTLFFLVTPQSSHQDLQNAKSHPSFRVDDRDNLLRHTGAGASSPSLLCQPFFSHSSLPARTFTLLNREKSGWKR